MDYSGKIPIRGDGRKLLEQARFVFMQEGYSVSAIAGQRFETSGGHPLRKNLNPIHGVSRAVFMVSPGTLTLEADLGGVRKVRNFMLVFLPSLGLGLTAIFLIVGTFAHWPPVLSLVFPLAPLAPWIVLVPTLLYIFRRQTIQALDTLLRNLQALDSE